MDPFGYAMGLIAVQDVHRQFEEIDAKRGRVSTAPAVRERGKLRRLANRLFARRGPVPATERA
jgi:hypothetical protein